MPTQPTQYAWSSIVWPPPTYYTGFGPFADDRKRDRFIHSIDNAIVEQDGRRYLRYQLPDTPVMPGSVRIDGYLFDTSDGNLVDFPKGDGEPGVVVGTIDHQNGLIVIDADLSPHLSRRRAEWYGPWVEPKAAC